MSASLPISDINQRIMHVSFGPIVLQKSSASAGSPKAGNFRIRKAEFLNQTSLLRPDLEKMFFAPRPKIFLQHYRS